MHLHMKDSILLLEQHDIGGTEASLYTLPTMNEAE